MFRLLDLRLNRFLRVRIFQLPKPGTAGEDRYAYSQRRRTFVLCDGASEGFDGRGWAGAVCRAALDGVSLRRVLRDARRRQDGALAETPDQDWSAILARKRGSFTTLLRVRVHGKGVVAHSVGDTFLLVLDGHRIVGGVPTTDPGDFEEFPNLLSDRPSDDLPPLLQTRFRLRSFRMPSLLLATDALALYLLSLPEGKREGVLRLLRGGSREEVRFFLEKGREEGAIRHDDLTFLWIILRGVHG